MGSKLLYLGLDPSRYRTTLPLVHLPLISIRPLPKDSLEIASALDHFSDYSHLLITSRNSFNILYSYLLDRGLSLKEWENKTILAVGRATAAAIEEKGVVVDDIPALECAEGIIDLLSKLHQERSLNFATAHFFWPHSALSRPLLSDYLKSQNALFSECILYDTEINRELSFPSLEDFKEIVFSSPSTVDAFLAVYHSFPEDKILTPIGPITDKYLQKMVALLKATPLIYTHSSSK